MSPKTKVVPDEVLSKEFLSQFKTEADVCQFLKQLHVQFLEKMLVGEMDVHLGYEKNSAAGNTSGNSCNRTYPKKIQTEHGQSVTSSLNPIFSFTQYFGHCRELMKEIYVSF